MGLYWAHGNVYLYDVFCVLVGTSSEADALLRTIMEANLSSEVALIVLDVVSLYTQHFKVNLAQVCVCVVCVCVCVCVCV